MRLLHGHERTDDASSVDDAMLLATCERYSVDELHAVAGLRGRGAFPGVPWDDSRPRTDHERTIVNDALVRSLIARGVVDAETRAPRPPHVTLFTVALDAETTCSVQRYRPYEILSRNAFLLEGLLVDEHAPHPNVVELAASDARSFAGWLARATAWSPTAALRTEIRQISRTVQKIRNSFGAVAANVPTTLEDQRVLDAGRVVTHRRSGDAVGGTDIGWITTVETVWVFPNASDLLAGYGNATEDVTLQATTEAELTRAVVRSTRAVVAS